MEFFMSMIPPTVTAQEHKVMVRNGKPVFYNPPELEDAHQKLTAHLIRHRPKKAIDKGIRLTVNGCSRKVPGIRTANTAPQDQTLTISRSFSKTV